MAQTTIEWTSYHRADGTVVPGYTFNPWWGCQKVSAGCEHCYAETFAKRTGNAVWGPAKTTERRMFGDKHWADPLRWHELAKAAGERHRVFCASMADVFEDHPQVVEARERLFSLIDRTPWLDWLLLTKRPENIQRLWPFWWYDDQFSWPNVWIGTSVEDQDAANARIPHLLAVPAKVRFLSCEPLLGPVTLESWFGLEAGNEWQECLCAEIDPSDRPCIVCEARQALGQASGISWVIVGGESGGHARPMHPAWAESLRDQCKSAGVPYFFKQWGEWIPKGSVDVPRSDFGVLSPSGEWYHKHTGWNGRPLDPDTGEAYMVRVGKKAAGRTLDGQLHSEFPAP